MLYRCSIAALSLVLAAAIPVPAAPAAPPPATPAMRRVSLSFNQADVRDILSILSEQGNVNIVMAPGVQGKISVTVRDVTVVEALDAICTAANLTYQPVSRTYVVYPANAPAPAVARPLTHRGVVTRTVSLNLNNVELHKALEQLASQSGQDIVLFGPLQDRVSVKISQIAFEEALAVLLYGTRYSYVKQREVYMIGDTQAMLAKVQGPLVDTVSFRLKHLRAKDLPAMLPPTLAAMGVKLDESANAVLITGSQETMARMDRFLRQVDMPQQQVRIDASVIELTKKASRQLGLTFSGAIMPTLNGVTSPFQLVFDSSKNDAQALQATLKALIENGDATVKANPSVTALNGKQALINVGRQLNVKVTLGTQLNQVVSLQQIEAGIKLQITPTIGSSGDILTDVQTEVSGITSVSADNLPEIARRTANTTVRVKSGQTILIGGLIQDDDKQSEQKIPILGDLPFVGPFFSVRNRDRSQSELIILITPVLVPDGQSYAPSARMKAVQP